MYFCRCEVEIIAKKLYLRPMRIVDEIEIKIKESEAGALFFVTDFANGGNDVFISRLLTAYNKSFNNHSSIRTFFKISLEVSEIMCTFAA